MLAATSTHPGSFFAHKRVPLRAGETLEIAATGNFISITGTLAPVNLGIDHGERFPVVSGFKFRLSGEDYFTRIVLENAQENDNVIEFYVGRGDVWDSRMNVVEARFFAKGPSVADIQALPATVFVAPTKANPRGDITLANGETLSLPGIGNASLNQGRRKWLRIFSNALAANRLLVYRTGDQSSAVFWDVVYGQTFREWETDENLTLKNSSGASMGIVVSELFYPYGLENPFATVTEPPPRFTWEETFGLISADALYPVAGTPNYPDIQIAGAGGTALRVKSGVGGYAKSARFQLLAEQSYTNPSRQRGYAYAKAAFFDLVSPRPERCRFTWDCYVPAAGWNTTEQGGSVALAQWCEIAIHMGVGVDVSPTQLIIKRGLSTIATITSLTFTPGKWYRFEWDIKLGVAGLQSLTVVRVEDEVTIGHIDASGDFGANTGVCTLDSLAGSAFVLYPSGLTVNNNSEPHFTHLGPVKIELF